MSDDKRDKGEAGARVGGTENPPSRGAENPVEAKVAQRLGEARVVQHYPPPDQDELPPPTFRQALIGYGSILVALVILGLLIGLLMKVLR